MNLKNSYEFYRYIWKAIDWIYPPACAACGRNNFRFCPDCLSSVRVLTSPICIICGKKVTGDYSLCNTCSKNNAYFSKGCAWAEYGGALRKAIHALKFQGDLGLGDYFSAFLTDLILAKGWQFDLVVPVPLSRQHKKERTYNQSELLSRPIARFFQVEHSNDVLRRVRETGRQVGRSRIDRQLAVRDAFSGNPAKLKGRKVLLVDDIITTGSTINNCAKALIEAGAGEVMAVSIAKTLKQEVSLNG